MTTYSHQNTWNSLEYRWNTVHVFVFHFARVFQWNTRIPFQFPRIHHLGRRRWLWPRFRPEATQISFENFAHFAPKPPKFCEATGYGWLSGEGPAVLTPATGCRLRPTGYGWLSGESPAVLSQATGYCTLRATGYGLRMAIQKGLVACS